jgi:hypothetical protein
VSAVVYATRSDLDDFGGIPRGSLSNEGRLVASSLAATDTITLSAHGFQTGDGVQLRATSGGTLSAPLVADTIYFAIRVSDSTFKLATSSANALAGTALDLTVDGVSMLVVKPLPIDRMLELYSRWIDGFLPAHVVPLAAPYPIVIVAICAQLAGKALMNLDGKSSDIVTAAETVAMAQLARWATGIPLRDAAVTTPVANRAINSSLFKSPDPRGWGSGSIP